MKLFTLIFSTFITVLVIPLTANAIVSVPEREALVALYESTNGGGWTDSTGWNTELDPCEWTGVTCVGEHVSKLELASNQLIGTLPAEIGALVNMTWLNLSLNQLSGPVPAELGALVNLIFLNLANNQLTGAVPFPVAQVGAASYCIFTGNTLCIPNTSEYQAIGVDPICYLALSDSCVVDEGAFSWPMFLPPITKNGIQ